jgi:CheY-like chemotaxis protein
VTERASRKEVDGKCGGVLVVDDDQDLRESLIELLGVEGYEAEAASNGAEALHFLHEEGKKKPCIILLDLMMPVMSGVEFRRKQLEDPELQSIPVVLLTAAHDGRQKADELGAVSYIPKPLELEPLFEALSIHCSKSQSLH